MIDLSASPEVISPILHDRLACCQKTTMDIKRLLKVLAGAAVFAGTISASAQTVELKGLTFSVISGKNECKLTKVESELTTLAIPSEVEIEGTKYAVTEVGSNAALNCDKIEAVSFPSTLRSIGRNSFDGCSSITAVEFNEGLITLGSYSFNNCTALKSITIPSTLTTFEVSVFFGCDALERVEVTDLSKWCSLSFNDASSNPISLAKHLYVNGNEVTSLDIPEGVSELKQYVFAGLASVTEVTVPASVKTIGANAFYGCSGIEAVNTPDLAAWCDINFDKSTSNPVSQCKVLKVNGQLLSEVTVPEGATTVKQYVFYNCTSISKITFPSTLTSLGNYAFYNCTGLEQIELPATLTTVGNAAFAGCSGLKSIVIPESVTSLPTNMFQNCKALESVILPSELVSIGKNVFFNCSKLGTIKFPASVKTIDQKSFQNCSALATIEFDGAPELIGDYAFQGCAALKTLILPEGVTGLGYNTYFGCTSLTEVTLPASMQSIGNNVFGNCTAIETIKCKSTTPPTAMANTFAASIYDTAGLVVPKGSAGSYASADVWKDFTNISESSFSGVGTLETEAGGMVTVYSITGHVVATGESVPELNAGVYIVRSGKKVSKIVVR